MNTNHDWTIYLYSHEDVEREFDLKFQGPGWYTKKLQKRGNSSPIVDSVLVTKTSQGYKCFVFKGRNGQEEMKKACELPSYGG